MPTWGKIREVGSPSAQLGNRAHNLEVSSGKFLALVRPVTRHGWYSTCFITVDTKQSALLLAVKDQDS